MNKFKLTIFCVRDKFNESGEIWDSLSREKQVEYLEKARSSTADYVRFETNYPVRYSYKDDTQHVGISDIKDIYFDTYQDLLSAVKALNHASDCNIMDSPKCGGSRFIY